MKELIKRLFKGRKNPGMIIWRCEQKITRSCEDENTVYITFPDGLRVIVHEGKYVGWYVCGTEKE